MFSTHAATTNTAAAAVVRRHGGRLQTKVAALQKPGLPGAHDASVCLHLRVLHLHAGATDSLHSGRQRVRLPAEGLSLQEQELREVDVAGVRAHLRVLHAA